MQNTTSAINKRAPGRRLRGHWPWFLALTLAALALRLRFILRFSTITPDGIVYGELARNWLLNHVYGLSGAAGPVPTYIRLPGYPAFLALLWAVTGVEHYNAVRFAQMVIDIGSCFLIAGLARRIAPDRVSGERMARWAFALAALCPFLANYTAAPLTETPAIFFTVLALDFALAALARQDRGANALSCWAACGLAIAAGIYLRPDGGILLIAIGGYLLYRLAVRPQKSRTFRAGAVLALCSLAPLAPWTLRNWRLFHEFQPLAPVAANAPGEFVPLGFQRWMRTWLVDFASVVDIGFRVDGEPISLETLPNRAFDSPDERRRTEELFAAYNENLELTPALDAQFAQLARQRIRRRPLRYYLELPLLRALDLWFRPRTELLPVDAHWWSFRKDPRDFAWALLLAAINLFYVALALAGLRHWRCLSYAGMLAAFVVLRTALITGLTFPEPRYVLECYPVVIAWAAAGLLWRSSRTTELNN